MPILAGTWTGALAAGTPADGAEVEGFFDEVEAVVNDIDDDNIQAGADIDASKLLDGSIPAGKYGAGSITGADIASLTIKDSNILAADTQGIQCLRTAIAQRKVLYGNFEVDASTGGDGTAGSPASWNAGVGSATSAHTITYATHAADYDANFTSSTEVVAQVSIENDQGPATEKIGYRITSTTNATLVIELRDEAAGGAFQPTGTITVHWVAFGQGT